MKKLAKFEHTFEINFRDVGKSNRLTNRAIIGYLEDAGGMHSNQAGYGLNNIEQTKLTWVLLYWKIRVFKRPLYGEKLHIQTWGRNGSKFYTFRDFYVYNEQEELVSIATSKWVLLNAETMSIEKITPELLAHYHPEDTKVFESEPEINKLIEPTTYSSAFSYTVQRKDIDINNHMHNVSYLDLAYEVLPEEVYFNTDFKNVEIMYKKEIKLGQTVRCFYCLLDGKHYITIKSEDESILHAIITLS